MAIEVGKTSGSISKFPPIPQPLKDDGFQGNTNQKGYTIPHKGTAINQVTIPAATNSLWVGSLNGVNIWSVSTANINAAADNWLGESSCWYDSVNDRLYVFCIDTTTTPDTLYTAYITLETGAVTNIGSAQFSVDPSSHTVIGNCAVSRTAIDSGNFTLHALDRTIVIDENTGAELSNVAEIEATLGQYATLDGTAFFNMSYNSDTAGKITVGRGRFTSTAPSPSYVIASDLVSVYALPWGNKVKMYRNSSGFSIMLRTFDRVEFDAWLQLVADYGGLA